MELGKHANMIATWLAILTTVIGFGTWVGSVSESVTSIKTNQVKTDTQVDKLRDDGPPAIARLEAQVGAVQEDVKNIKQTQQDILHELRQK